MWIDHFPSTGSGDLGELVLLNDYIKRVEPTRSAQADGRVIFSLSKLSRCALSHKMTGEKTVHRQSEEKRDLHLGG
jgi:hypothetical protein